MTLDHDDGPAVLQSDETPSGEHQVVKPKRREKKKKSDIKVRDWVWYTIYNVVNVLADADFTQVWFSEQQQQTAD